MSDDPNPAVSVESTQSLVVIVMPGEPDPPVIPLAQRTVLPCAPGQVIARVTDVPEGAPTPAMATPKETLRLGKGVAWDATGQEIVAEITGHIRLVSGQICVEEELDINTDVDPSGGEIAFAGPITIHRDVHDLVHLKAGGLVTVHGSVEAAVIETQGDLIVHHGICGKERGRVHVHGNTDARFISNANVRVDGNITVGNEVANSRILCGGEFKSEQVSVLGGHITAVKGIVCHTAGSPTGVKTILELGVNPESLAQASQALASVESCRQRAEDIRKVVGPLLQNQKSLTAAQKEKATELLFRADELEQETRRLMPAIVQQQTGLQAAAGGVIRVVHTLHAGVIIRYPNVEAQLTKDLRGPVKIAVRPVEGQQRIVAVAEHGGGVTVLPGVSPQAAHAASVSRILGFKTA